MGLAAPVPLGAVVRMGAGVELVSPLGQLMIGVSIHFLEAF